MAVKNLVSGVLAQPITTSTTNVLVNVAQGISASDIQSFFPTPPFYITIMPKTPAVGVANRLDSEILQVTAVGSDQSGNASLTCVRGQRDTTAKAFNVGAIVTVGVYADDAVFLGGEGSAVGNPAPWVETSDIKNGAITTDKIADGAVKSAKIDWATFKFPIPDYSNGTSISNSTNTWTSPKCGVVIAVLIADTANGYKNVTISVNDKTVASALWAGATGGYNFQTRAIIPVATGDVVKFSAKDGGSTVDGRVFYPYKWV